MSTSDCCAKIPPVHSDYQAKGQKDVTVGGLKCYVVGPESASTVLIGVYDIFGYAPQTYQGADILSETLGARVLLPDLFRGDYWPHDKFPPSGDDGKKLGEYIGNVCAPPKTSQEVVALAKELASSSSVKGIGLYGYCIGAKITGLASGDSSVTSHKVKAVVNVHPAGIDPDDAKKLQVPILWAPTKDEDKKVSDKFYANVESSSVGKQSVKHQYEAFHGFASARADLKDPTNLKDYEDFYSRAAGFFKALL
ncbi:uncharacterized protein L969DRAFT_46880 [Mixia osmundae IAM 14324]|uniref:Dienelactone hydrolase domain-containing protein n=1 Tax=Mixia osmundae (strain CBS 9802 / IAM 14324 / JCM 22182 / KY 12970) TaxID=764103 RepID=G7DZK2_MIXOS|nr:uncharacterized protein L969DRAFT_46880 [Mixia osmundae IAM 14324]KEI40947.1 hypothetical protein L969DRAFT_46880 [Mixia osmundae IAM 14324]GAA96012.1 hypothetical protein E5Q_02672 [Mixia osmundae IAM 14324]